MLSVMLVLPFTSLPTVVDLSLHVFQWYVFDSEDCWTSEDESVDIREGSTVRVRIEGLDIDAGVIVSLLFNCCYRYLYWTVLFLIWIFVPSSNILSYGGLWFFSSDCDWIYQRFLLGPNNVISVLYAGIGGSFTTSCCGNQNEFTLVFVFQLIMTAR